MDKTTLRETFLGIRRAVTEASVAERSAALCRRLATMTLVREAEMVLAYLAFGGELDVSALFERLPEIEWAVPRIEGQHLSLHPYTPEGLIRHAYGMLEPAANSPVVDPEQVDLVLVPGVSFDWCGGRLGYGGGFYDRFLSRASAIRVGVCDDSCLTEELPHDGHDQRMDWVVTPTMAIHCAPCWRRTDGQGPEAS